jgi:methylthioribose-1-phosphate isomerase
MDHGSVGLSAMPETMRWAGDHLRLLDQTRLPFEERIIECRSLDDVATAIRTLQVRGAPAIGAAAAFGLVLAVSVHPPGDRSQFVRELTSAADILLQTRPTAVNLRWALERMLAVPARAPEAGVDQLRQMVLDEAQRIATEDVITNRAIAQFGAALIGTGERVLTYCNTGSLATVGYGTAFGIVRQAHEQGRSVHVYACETRPVLQGARLTTWEILRCGLSGTLITDNAAGALMGRGLINRVIVGADRIAANGDVANKIGTYTLAVLAHAHQIPFIVAAPISTVDFRAQDGRAIPIEERTPDEVTHFAGKRIAPVGMTALNLAFDVTPHQLITAIVTEAGVAWPPFSRSLHELAARNKESV